MTRTATGASIERGPEGEGDKLGSYVEGYGVADAGWTVNSILSDLQSRINSGDLTEEEATAIADSLGI